MQPHPINHTHHTHLPHVQFLAIDKALVLLDDLPFTHLITANHKTQKRVVRCMGYIGEGRYGRERGEGGREGRGGGGRVERGMYIMSSTFAKGVLYQ